MNMIAFYDSHCHLNDDLLYPKRREIVEESIQNGVKALLIVGFDLPSSEKAVEIAHEFPGCYASIGYQPENLEDAKEEDIARFEFLAKDERVLAIGEIGLDYHWFKEEAHRARQKEWFIKQIELANRLDLPVSIHARDAIGDTLVILKEHPVKRKGVLHCYSGSVESMKELEKLGYYFGFDGPITFKNAIEPKRCVKECRGDRLLVETDSPYLSPVPFRGKENSPKNIPLIVKQMAELRGEEMEETAENLKANFETLFRVKL